MNMNQLHTMAYAVLDHIKRLGEQSEFVQISDHAIHRMVLEVLHFWERDGLRRIYFEPIADDELASFIEDNIDDEAMATNLATKLRKRYDICRKSNK